MTDSTTDSRGKASTECRATLIYLEHVNIHAKESTVPLCSPSLAVQCMAGQAPRHHACRGRFCAVDSDEGRREGKQQTRQTDACVPSPPPPPPPPVSASASRQTIKMTVGSLILQIQEEADRVEE
ncbi:hypothetical protein O3P69_014089 [Scylla paramamosain]|uniref:Uncharacterized protein n=1 Tax=Scylla paramamosain TaxID=85552 RepID=A0AAW0SR86_SCYPA